MNTYIPEPIDTSGIDLPDRLKNLTESLAENTHEHWAAQRIADGWTYGPKRDDAAMHNPCLVPYNSLSESEKEYDRLTAMETIKVLVALEYL